MPSEDEVVKEMRGSANRLSDCLDSLLRRIEQLEHQREATGGGSRAQSPTAASSTTKENGPSSGESRREYVSVDPLTGQRRLVTVLERQLPSGPLRAQSPTLLNGHGADLQQNASGTGGWASPGRRLLASAYESRIVEVQPAMLEGLELEQICGQLVAVKVTPELAQLIRPGDTLVELDGQPLTHRKQLHQPKGAVQLKLVLSDLFSAPMEFCRVLDDYQASQSQQQQQNQQQQHPQEDGQFPPAKQPLLPYLSFPLQRGDILQVLSRDSQYFQARKVNDLSTAGFVPNNIRTRPVAMLCPYGRRVIALLGANGVGRRTLKRMLIEYRPHQFAGVVAVTSRAPHPGEQQGREYEFERKEDILQQIRQKQMIEWGEWKGQLYGTRADSVRQVMRSGRVCVLDCTLKALECLYGSEFMPFIVVVAAPPLDELLQLRRLHGGTTPKSDAELQEICEQSDRLLRESDWARQADLVLVNRNRDISLRRLLDALEALKSEPQWVPREWIQQR